MTLISEVDVGSQPRVGVTRSRRQVLAGHNYAVIAAVSWVTLLVVLAVVAQWLPIVSPLRLYSAPRQAPSLSLNLLLGTDSLGRSQLSRAIWGTRASLSIGIASVGIGLVVGGGLGLVAGSLRGWTDRLVMLENDSLLAFPGLVLALAVRAVLGANILAIILALGVASVPPFVRLVRAQTLVLMKREFVMSSRGLGARYGRTILREIIPNLWVPISAYAFILVGWIIVAEASMSFLGIGVPSPSPSWGSMIADGQPFLATQPYMLFTPALLIVFTVFSLNIIGDRLSRSTNTGRR